MSTETVRKMYRELFHVIHQLPSSTQRHHGLQELRATFRRPIAHNETLEQRIQTAKDRAAFLRITTPKTKARGESGRWIYRDGQKLSQVDGTFRDAKGQVVSNWDGKNLDPESVRRHKQDLKRMGFINNSHAKGFF